MTETRYGFGIDLPGSTFDDAVVKIRDALKAEGFGVLTEIDVRDTLKKKLDADFGPTSFWAPATRRSPNARSRRNPR